MARELDDMAFWLPSEFLTDDDLLTDSRFKTTKLDEFSYGLGNSFGFNSDLSSPGELVTETESEEDDGVAELTRKLAQSTLRNSFFSSDYASKGWKQHSGSPQSTLCGCKPGPTASPNSVSGFCSPSDTEDYLRRDFLYAAAEEVARMRMIEETAAFYSSKHFPPQAKPRPVAAAPQPNPAAVFYRNQARSQNHQLSSQLLQAAKIKQMKQQQMVMNRDYRHRVSELELQTGMRNGGDGRQRGMSMAAWPAVQQPGSGRRGAFLGEPGLKKERTGTGVFLPQRLGSVPAETRKKSGCPTALVPEKVVQALNINVDSIDAHLLQRSRNYGASNFDYEAAAAAAALKQRNNLIMAQQRRNLAAQNAVNQQHRLPQDWTY